MDSGAPSRGSSGICPLCESALFSPETPISVAAIRAYWKGFGYDIDADFPALPEYLLQRRCTSCGLHWFAPSLIAPAALYERLEQWPAYYRSQAWEWDETIKILRRAGISEVLEVGSGTGEFLEQARRSLPHCEGIEFNVSAMETAKKRGLAVTDRPLESVPGQRPAIVAHQLLEHLETPGAFFQTCANKLGPGGLLIVAVPNQEGFAGTLEANFLNRPPHHATLWRKSCFRTAALRFGLDFTEYYSAPLELRQYKTHLMRHARPSRTLPGKMCNLAKRAVTEIVAPLIFPFARRELAGEAHLAVFRKPEK